MHRAAFSRVLSVLDELRQAAAEVPDQVVLVIDEHEVSFAELHAEVTQFAAVLRAAGIGPGDRVLVMLPNRIEAVWAWLGTQAAGAVDAPVSVEAVGASLRHMVTEIDARAIVTTSELFDRALSVVENHNIELAFLVDSLVETGAQGEVAVVDVHNRMSDELPIETQSPEPHELATILFSSGSSGPPKGVMLPHGYYANIPHAHSAAFRLEPLSTIYCTQPLCHIDPRMIIVDAIYWRCRVVLTAGFSASRYWNDVERHDADVFMFIGAMLPLLYKQPVPDVRPIRKRLGMGAAVPPALHRSFCERFNAELLEGYGMTEVPAVLNQRRGSGTPGNVGSPLPGVEVVLADLAGQRVADGTAGELLIRPTSPNIVMSGYWRRPDATVATWRDLWLHTGDLLRMLPSGEFEYLGRIKDSIRRRGENVSAWEVEQVAIAIEGVAEAAAIGIPSELGEEDIALFVVLGPAGEKDAPGLRATLAADLPRFALPRYIEFVDQLPTTPSARVAKGVLRERGISGNAFDAEGASA